MESVTNDNVPFLPAESRTCRICGRQDRCILRNVSENDRVRKIFNDLFPLIEFGKADELPTVVCHVCICVSFDFHKIWKRSNPVQRELADRVKLLTQCGADKGLSNSANESVTVDSSMRIAPVVIPEDGATCASENTKRSAFPKEEPNLIVENDERQVPGWQNDEKHATESGRNQAVCQTACSTTVELNSNGAYNNDKQSAPNVLDKQTGSTAAMTIPQKVFDGIRSQDELAVTSVENELEQEPNWTGRLVVSSVKSVNEGLSTTKLPEPVPLAEKAQIITVLKREIPDTKTSALLRGDKKSSSRWRAYSLPQRSTKLHHCLLCNAILLTEGAKNSHKCDSSTQITHKRRGTKSKKMKRSATDNSSAGSGHVRKKRKLKQLSVTKDSDSKNDTLLPPSSVDEKSLKAGSEREKHENRGD